MNRVNQLRRHRTTILAIFSFLLGWMMATNLTPIDRTCQIEDTDREYNIMKNSKLKNPELIVLILSAPKNIDLRSTVRRTWLKLQNHDKRMDDKVKFKMKHYFVIGSLGLNSNELQKIITEQTTYNDILLLPIYDSYRNLTNKVRKSFEWLNEQYDYGLSFKYVLKCDDDSFVRLDNLLNELQNIELFYLKADIKHTLDLVNDVTSPFIRINVQNNDKNTTRNSLHLYWGYFSGSARIKSKGKYKETEWIACDRYVPYALGGGYILSKNLVSFIAKNSDNLRMFNAEDISVGLWLAPVNNILRIHDTRFDTEWTSRGCQNYYLITHKMSMHDMKQLYNNVVKTNRLCSEETLTRTSYLYNWSNLPSQCCITQN